jgi:hypothetical protein
MALPCGESLMCNALSLCRSCQNTHLKATGRAISWFADTGALQDRLREAHKEAAAERDTAAARGEEVQRCKAYIETVEAKLRVHGEYISQLETSLSDAQVRAPPALQRSLDHQHLLQRACCSFAQALELHGRLLRSCTLGALSFRPCGKAPLP